MDGIYSKSNGQYPPWFHLNLIRTVKKNSNLFGKQFDSGFGVSSLSLPYNQFPVKEIEVV